MQSKQELRMMLLKGTLDDKNIMELVLVIATLVRVSSRDLHPDLFNNEMNECWTDNDKVV